MSSFAKAVKCPVVVTDVAGNELWRSFEPSELERRFGRFRATFIRPEGLFLLIAVIEP